VQEQPLEKKQQNHQKLTRYKSTNYKKHIINNKKIQNPTKGKTEVISLIDV